jgi:hypothetical protein
MKTTIYLLSIIFLSLIYLDANAQGVSINADGSDPHASAMLDIQSTTTGLLVPRMTIFEVYSISSPADGLIVYSTTDHNFYYWNSASGWEKIIAGDADDGDWSMDGNDMYNVNTGNVGIGATTSVATHKLTVEDNNTTNVLRLIGPGSFGFGAKLNFGDSDYAYISEAADDYLTVFGSSALYLNSSNNVYNTALYGNVFLSAPSGGVGINLSDVPTADLDVDGVVRFRQADPAPYKVLTATDTDGNATWQPVRTLKFPDGQFPMEPITWQYTQGNYTVPAGKNLYITNTYNQNSAGYYISINGLRVMQGYNNYAGTHTSEGPIIAGAGQVVTMYGYVRFNGFLIDATVTPVTTTSTITVTAGQTLVITSVCGLGGQAPLTVDNKYIYYGYGNFNSGSSYNYHGLREPVLVGEGSTVSYGGRTMNGYYITQ